jgi:hypothetical protein
LVRYHSGIGCNIFILNSTIKSFMKPPHRFQVYWSGF